MTPSALAQLALDLGKATFDNTFTTVDTVSAWLEGGARSASRALPLLPLPLAGVVDETLGFVARTRTDFKQTVDRCYVLVSGLLSSEVPNATPAAGTGASQMSRAS
jgi:hypothetical protein